MRHVFVTKGKISGTLAKLCLFVFFLTIQQFKDNIFQMIYYYESLIMLKFLHHHQIMLRKL